MLQIKRPIFEAMLIHLQTHYPLEACGLLAGPPTEALRWYPVENKLRSPVAYEMEPRQQLQAMLDIEERGWEMLAIVHSHPHGPETPSPTDVAQAYYPEPVHLIVSLQKRDAPRVRAFAIWKGTVEEIPFQVQP